MNGLKVIADGLGDAVASWIELFQNEEGGLFGGKVYTKEEALTVLKFYKKHKLVNADHIARRYTVKHGGYLEREFVDWVLTES